jgi:hypothetical protein
MDSRLLRIAAVAISMVVVLSGWSAPVHAQSANNTVTEWNLIAANTLLLFPPPAGGAAPALQVNMAMVQGAVYDAVNAIAPNPRHRRPYLLEKRFASTASREAAAATAAHSVLSNVVSTVPDRIPFPNRADLLQALDTAYETSLAAIPDGPSRTQGIAAGNAAADAMMRRRRSSKG